MLVSQVAIFPTAFCIWWIGEEVGYGVYRSDKSNTHRQFDGDVKKFDGDVKNG